MNKSMFKVVAAATLAAAVVHAETPDKFVRYVESTGSQYVDTGVTGRYNTRIEMQFEWMNIAEQMMLGCGDWSDSTRFYACYCLNSDGNIATGQSSYERVVYTNIANSTWNSWFEKNRVYDYAIEFTAKDGDGNSTRKIVIDGIKFRNETTAAVDTGKNLYLFAHNRGSEVRYYSKARCYRLRIWQGTTAGGEQVLVRDFIPCIKNHRAGLYDAVSGNIFYSASGTDLVCDEDSNTPDEFVEYVESTGACFIDTEVDARSGTSAECDVAVLHKNSLRLGLLGALAADGTYFDLIHAYQDKFACSYGTRGETGGSYWTGNRYYVASSLSAGVQALTVAANGSATTNTVSSGTDAAEIDTGLSLHLFGRNVGGNIDSRGLYRLYGLKIKQDGVLVRDFKPCLKDGAFALYDGVSGRIFYPKRGLLNGPVRQTQVKAKDLIFVDYIESDGTQTLDTGVRARHGTRAKGEFAWAEALRELKTERGRYLEEPVFRHLRVFLGADDPSYWPTYYYMVYAEDRYLAGYYGNGVGKSNSEVKYWDWAKAGSDWVQMTTAGVKYAFDASFMDEAQTIEWNGTNVWSLSNSANFDSGKNLHIFSSGSRYRSAARCYGLEIWQDGEKVRDFKPCIYEGKAMLYDTLTESVFRPSPDIPASKTGGVILTGDEKPAYYVDYVESDGTIFVDTGVRGKSGTASNMKVRFLEAGDIGIACTYNSSLASDYRRFYLCYNLMKHSNAIQYGYGSNQTAFSAVTGRDYVIETSLSVGSQTFTVDGALKVSNTDTKEIDTGLDIWLFAFNFDNAPKYNGKTRLYYLKLYQGDADGSNMKLVRNFKPVKLSNGLVVLWDFEENKPYLPQLVSSPGTLAQFPVVGNVGEKVSKPFTLVFR
ncbi:MAG: hypothetical protein IKO40_09305 [Kiritimatiellae bacterium]|nr:hypothetical protein [Kiritimatiellia bacterium]